MPCLINVVGSRLAVLAGCVFLLAGHAQASAPAIPPEAASCSYSAADLAATPDVVLTPEIQALAATLNYAPARIFEYVANTIAFEPYFGSLKGAVGALYSKAGGSTDQASLLIALLRSSNIPARYVRGTIQVLDATGAVDGGRVGRWVGGKTYIGATKILAQGRFNPLRYTTGVQLEQVWVEACVPYGRYRGAAIDKSGFRWIPLDASFKDKTYQAGIVTNLNFDYTSYLAARTNGADSLPHERYVLQAESAVRASDPSATVEDVPYKGTINKLAVDILPASLPYEVVGFTNWPGSSSPETAQLPDAHRFRLYVNGLGLPTSKALFLPEIALKRLTLFFKGASTGDQTALDTWRTDSNLSSAIPCTINVTPVLRLDGADLGISAGTVGLCTSSNAMTLEVGLLERAVGGGDDPNSVGRQNYVSYSNIGAANWHGLQAYAFQGSDRLIAERSAKLLGSVQATPNPNASTDALDETEGELLHLVGLKYMRYITDSNKTIGGIDGSSGESGNHLGLASSRMKVQYLFDLPYAVNRTGFLIDVPGGVSRTVDLSTGAIVYKTFLLSGYAASAYESAIWQENARLDAVSTVRGLQFANETGIGTLVATSANWSAVRPQLSVYPGSSATDCAYNPSTLQYSRCSIDTGIQSLLGQGYTVTLPKSLIQYGDWKGVVYVAERNNLPTSASVSYAINKYAGGYTIGSPLPTSFNAGLNSGLINQNEVPGFLQPTNNSFGAVNSTTFANGLTPYTTTSADPVNMVTGNVYHNERDLSIKGRGLPIVFERAYNSRTPVDGPLGFGWTHSFNHSLKFYGVEGGTAKLSWIDGTGAEHFFATSGHSAGNITPGSTIANPVGVYVSFVREAGGQYTIREKNGLIYRFASATGPSGVPGTATPTIAQLLSITDRNGNALSLSYSATGSCSGGSLLCAVTDPLGRSLTFSYSGNHITQIQDFAGRKFQYGYTDGNNNLTSFKNPLAVAGSQNPVTYTYYTATDGVNLGHVLKQTTLPRGNGMRFEYYASGRAFRQTVVLTDGSLSPDHVNTFTFNDFRRETVQINERNLERHFFFDANGNPLKITEENGADHVYEYTQPGQPFNRTTKIDATGYRTQYAYDANGNVTTVTPPRGAAAQVRLFDFTTFNQPQRIVDGRGIWSIMRYDARGNLTDSIRTKIGYSPGTCTTTCATPPANQIISWNVNGYDSYGNLIAAKRVRDFAAQIASPSATSNTGPILGTIYDASGLNATGVSRTGLKNSDVSVTTQSAPLTYDTLGRLKTGIDGDWQATQFFYDDLDRITSATDRLGKLRSYRFDANGNPLEQKLTMTVGGTMTLVDSSSARFDDYDRRINATDAGGFVTSYGYDVSNNLTSITNPDNYTLAFEYDEANRIVRAVDQENNAAITTRDTDGRTRKVTDPNGNAVTYSYWDASRDGRLKSVSAPTIQSFTSGHALATDYDENGNAITVTDTPAAGSGQSARITSTSYDELNRPVRTVGPLYTDATYGAICPVTVATWDTLGRVTQVAAGRATSPCVNAAADVLTIQSTIAFDDFGRKIKQADALGNFSTIAYDSNNNPLTVIDAKNQSTSYTWDYGHQLHTRTEQGGRLTTITRNALGQPTQTVHPEVTTTARYDNAHRLAQVIDSRGNKILNYDWSPGGLLNRITDNNNRTTRYGYDPVGRLASVTAPNNDVATYRFDAAGRLAEKLLANGASARYQYNADNSLKQIVNRNSTASILTQHDYTYDGVGNRNTQAEVIGGATINYAYSYDELKRLTQVVNGTPAAQENYGYDPIGNRTTKAIGQSSPTVTAYVYDDANQLKELRQNSNAGALLASLSYDNNGNLQSDGSRNYTWDAIDQLSQVSKGGITVRYGYDAEGKRIRKTVNGINTNWLYDGEDIYAEYGSNIANLTSTPTALYTSGGGTDDPLVIATLNVSNQFTKAEYYYADGLGSVVGLSNSNDATTQTQRFDAWGNKLSGTIAQTEQYGYTGREPDETGLTYYRARYSDPALGRFVSRDPSGMAGGLNLYAYVGNNPVNASDPSGLLARSVVFGAQSVYPPTMVSDSGNGVGYQGLTDATKTGGTDSRPDKCDMICVNQSTGLATTRTFHSGDFVKDQMNEMYSNAIAPVWNAFVTVGKTWSEISIFGLGGADAEGAAVVAQKTEYLYRGVSAGHPALEAALKGRAVPGNVLGKVTEEAHNLGGVAAESQFTSWTRSLEVATQHANKNGPGGVILQAPVGAPPKGASWSWSWSPDIYHESEVLLQGVRNGLKRISP